jgi:hypothetical protein
MIALSQDADMKEGALNKSHLSVPRERKSTYVLGVISSLCKKLPQIL